MIRMKNWHVCVPEGDQTIGYDGENLVYRLQIETDSLPDWAYKLDLRYENGRKNYLELIYAEGVLYVDILRDYLIQGFVKAQIRALLGEQEKHSNRFDLYVSPSINATSAFELTEPSAFEQLEQRLTGLKQDTETAAGNAAESAAAALQSAQDADASNTQANLSAQAAEESRQAAALIVENGQAAIFAAGDTEIERLRTSADTQLTQIQETGAEVLTDIDEAVNAKLEQAEGAADAAEAAQAAAEAAKNEAETAAAASKQSAEDSSSLLTQNQELLNQNKEIAVKTPYIGTNGNWFVWNNTTGVFEDSGIQAQGERGNNGVAVEADGIYAFNIDENGHLILSYTGEEQPDFSINDNGHLIYNFE